MNMKNYKKRKLQNLVMTVVVIAVGIIYNQINFFN